MGNNDLVVRNTRGWVVGDVCFLMKKKMCGIE